MEKESAGAPAAYAADSGTAPDKQPGAPPSAEQVSQGSVTEERPHRLSAISCHELQDRKHLDHGESPFQVICEQDVERSCLPRESRNKIARIRLPASRARGGQEFRGEEPTGSF